MINFIFTGPRINSVAVKANISKKEKKTDIKIIVIIILNELGKSRRDGDQGTSPASEIKSFLVEHLFRGQPRSQGLSSSRPSERGETLLSRLGGKMRDPGNEVV